MERKLLESTCRLAGCLAIALTSLAADTTLFQLRLVLDAPNAAAEQLPVLGGATARTVNVQKIPLLDLQDVESAAAATEKGTDKPLVTVTLTPEGRKRLAAAAQSNANKRIAVVINGKIWSTSMIEAPLAEGSVAVRGEFTPAQATGLAEKINAAVGKPHD